jgi:hypothetical protein
MFPASELHRAYQTYAGRRDGANSAVLVEAMLYLIDHRLADARELLPGTSARELLAELANLGAIHQTGGLTERLTIYGVSATCNAGGAGLLRNWQIAARRALDKQNADQAEAAA